jgi:hypothetical protein
MNAMITKIKIELPTTDQLLHGLSPHEVHPPLVAARAAVVAAEHALGRKRAELADHEKTVAALPDRIQRGDLRTDVLTNGLRARDAAALVIGPAEAALAKARERLPVEERAAKQALEREVHRRLEQLERTAAELAPVLTTLNELSRALALVLAPTAIGGFPSVDWPCATSCGVNIRGVLLSQSGGPR